ncbi:MAG: hypothetical protein QM765_11070 [Myxococcales bacterium]
MKVTSPGLPRVTASRTSPTPAKPQARTTGAAAGARDAFEGTSRPRSGTVDLRPAAQPDPGDPTVVAARAEFQALPESTRASVLKVLGQHPNDAEIRAALASLATSPGFAKLEAAEQGRLMRFAGGTSLLLSRMPRLELVSLAQRAEYTSADADGQAGQLRKLLADQPGIQQVVSPCFDVKGATTSLPYTITGPEAAEGHAWEAKGAQEAVRYTVEVQGQKIPVFLPKNTDPAQGHFHSIEQVAKGLASLPPHLRAMTTEVSVEPQRNSLDAFWAQQYGNPNFHSYMTCGRDGQIRIYPSSSPVSQESMSSTMVHEMGHTVSTRLWGDDYGAKWDDWKKAADSDGLRVSQYAANAPGEDFSETLAMYQLVKGTPAEAELRERIPARLAFLDQILEAR